MLARLVVAAALFASVLGAATVRDAAAAPRETAAAPVEPTGELREVFASGTAALKAGRLDEAEAAFRRLIAAGAGVAQVRNNLGIVFEQRGEHRKAAAEFREAARLAPTHAAPRILLGASLLALGRAAEARTELQKAVEIAPREPLARVQLARAHQAAGDWAGAVDEYRALTRMEPANPDYLYGLGTSYLRLSEWSLRELGRVAPRSARVDQAAGHGLRVQGRPDRALEAFARAAAADPTMPEIHLAMAQVHMEEGRFADARREAERELAIVPESAGARALLARIAQLEAARR
jgi:tetratricopeptide (TPR) repeat protein